MPPSFTISISNLFFSDEEIPDAENVKPTNGFNKKAFVSLIKNSILANIYVFGRRRANR